MSSAKLSFTAQRATALALLAAAGVGTPTAVAHAINAVGGNATSTTVTLNSGSEQVLTQTSFTLSNGPHTCMAVASAWANNPQVGTNRYNFAVQLDASSGVGFSLRKIEFQQTSEKAQIVSTNFTFLDVGDGDHTIAFIGQKEATNMRDLGVKRPSLSVVCTKQTLALKP